MSPHTFFWVFLGLLGVTFYLVHEWLNRGKVPKGLKLPPGPPGRFLIGNVFDLPTTREWLTFNRWAKEYGDLVYLNVFGISLLFVNSYEHARELFDKRSNIYSERPYSVVFTELSGIDWSIITMPYGQNWRQSRAYLRQYFSQTSVQNYREALMKHTKVLVKLLYRSPDCFRSHIRFVMGAIIMEVTYGIKATSEKNPYLVLSEETILELSKVGLPGAYLVDVMPFLKHIPLWFPGAKFRRELNELRIKAQRLNDEPMKFVKAALRDGNTVPCIATSFLEQFENDPDRPADYEDTVQKIMGNIYLAGIDTMDAYILLFVRAMLLHPHVQKRAQEELDEVVGIDGLPSFEHFSKLKYVRAISQEVMRWNTVTPAALPHSVAVDDVIDGYFIPKGTVVFGNSWTLLRSKSVYGTDADEFKPERFLDENTPLPEFGFGYGRRVCPGRYYGEIAAFIVSACILHLFHILPTYGENGPELPGEDDFDSGVVLRPKDFNCRIIPRSSVAVYTLDELEI